MMLAEQSARQKLSPLHLSLGGLLFLTVGRIHEYFPLLSSLRPGLLLFSFSVLSAVFIPKQLSVQSSWREWPAKAMLFLFLVFVASSLAGLSAGASLSFLSGFSTTITLYLLLLMTSRSTRHLEFFSTVFLAALIVIMCAVLFLGETVSFGDYTRTGGTAMYDGNDIGVFFAAGLPIAVATVRSRRGWRRALGLATLIGVPVVLSLTASRGGFLGLLACVIGLLILSPGISLARRIAIVALVGGTFTIAAPAGYWKQMGTILSKDDYNVTSETGRKAIWTRGMGYVAQYPVFGIGPGNFVRAGWMISAESRQGQGIRPQDPHNTFLQFWAELGTVGFLTVLALSLGTPIALLRRRNRLPRSWLRGTPDQRYLYLLLGYLPVSFLGFSVSAFFVSHAWLAMFYVLVALSCAVLSLTKSRSPI